MEKRIEVRKVSEIRFEVKFVGFEQFDAEWEVWPTRPFSTPSMDQVVHDVAGRWPGTPVFDPISVIWRKAPYIR